MSQELLNFIVEFLDGDSDCASFCDEYIFRWKAEGRDGKLTFDEPKASEILSTVFCLSDLFNADDDREEYELDEPKLRHEIRRALNGLPFELMGKG